MFSIMISTKFSANQALVIEFRRAEGTQNYLSIRMATGYDVWLRLRIYVDTFRIAVDGDGADQLGDGVLRYLQICVGKNGNARIIILSNNPFEHA